MNYMLEISEKYKTTIVASMLPMAGLLADTKSSFTILLILEFLLFTVTVLLEMEDDFIQTALMNFPLNTITTYTTYNLYSMQIVCNTSIHHNNIS